VQVRLKGINTIRAKLADGTVKTYYYHKLSGRRLSGEPGTPAFLASIAEAEVAAESVSGHLFRAIIVGYRTAPEFQSLKPRPWTLFGTSILGGHCRWPRWQWLSWRRDSLVHSGNKSSKMPAKRQSGGRPKRT
jgi:hypothetical protein